MTRQFGTGSCWSTSQRACWRTLRRVG